MSIEDVKRSLESSARLKMLVAEKLAVGIDETALRLADVLRNGGKAIFCGNGGSAADSQHLATELVVRLSGRSNRPALAAMALTTDTSILTACANDFGFERIFSRQLEALGRKGDILFALSTSGNSANVVNAVELARKTGIVTVGLLGCGGGRLSGLVDYPLVVPSDDVQRIQECHITIGHIIIELAEAGFLR
ncbi:MAG: phosphoheptose isomerase [candidate division Zixibacteria bacterium RBG_16_53_22]|nr:MAG: phosphoheptose isomerase [candidate division Zixibacteria bacterium RBG_16_53_22]